MAQQLTALAALAEGMCSVPRTYARQLTPPTPSSSKGSGYLSWPPQKNSRRCKYICTRACASVCTHTNAHTHQIRFEKFFSELDSGILGKGQEE